MPATLENARQIDVPPTVERLMQAGATLAVSISGGKDSQALLFSLARLFEKQKWPGRIYALHADLGRAEWTGLSGHVSAICERAGVELVVVRRTKENAQGESVHYDLFDRIEDRMKALAGTGKPFWPSAASRYCTSSMKRMPLNREMRKDELIVCATGIRAEESSARKEKEKLEVRAAITTKSLKECNPGEAAARWLAARERKREGTSTKIDRTSGLLRGRLGLTWRPLLEFTEADVWAACGTSREELEERRRLFAAGREKEALGGWPAAHPYVRGNERVSCSLCILGCKGDLIGGARHNPEAFQFLLDLERKSGFTFKQDVSLEEIGRRVERGERPATLSAPTLF